MCRSGPSLLEKSSSRRNRDPSASCNTVADPLVSCSWLTNVPVASATGSAGGSGAGGDADAGVSVVRFGVGPGRSEPVVVAELDVFVGSVAGAVTDGSASSMLLEVNSFQGWNQ